MLNLILIIVPVLLNIAFFTLLERKILGLSQSRKGPNKVSSGGLLQPFADAIKLFGKELTSPVRAQKTIFLLSPILAMAIALALWGLASILSNPISWDLSIILLMVFLGINLYPLLMAGWVSDSKYANIGALRGVAQTISYEISLALILLSLISLTGGTSMINWTTAYSLTVTALAGLPIIIVWMVSCVAETNRTPFDFSEGESELVSGFNIEYGSGGFALLFMAEYGIILFFSLVSAIILLSEPGLSGVSAGLTVGLAFWWVWLRATYPRYRYDKLMNLSWKSILPLALSWLMVSSAVVLV